MLGPVQSTERQGLTNPVAELLDRIQKLEVGRGTDRLGVNSLQLYQSRCSFSL